MDKADLITGKGDIQEKLSRRGMLTAVIAGVLGWHGPGRLRAAAKPVKPKRKPEPMPTLSMTTFTYDSCAGAPASGSLTRFVYDADNRLVTVVDGLRRRGSSFPA
jgi:hypothetical protein